ncbi:MAG: metal ABC transporter permease, partial [Candidatus Nanopelagicales bacterium]
MEWLLEPFALGFQQRALLGGALAGLMSAVVGTWLVLRGMSFFGDAFVHGVVPGIAAAVVLDINPVIGAAVAALAGYPDAEPCVTYPKRFTLPDLSEDLARALALLGSPVELGATLKV